MWIDWDYPQSVVALHIYRMGRSVPIRSRNPNKSRVKIQLLTRIRHFGLVWLVSEPVWPPWTGLTGQTGVQIFWYNFLIRTPNWTFHICISIVPTRSTQWCSPIDDLTNFSWPVWPVCTWGLTGMSRSSRKSESCQFWVSTYAPLFLGKACISRNISPSLNCT